MSSTLYTLFKDSVFELVETMVIKHHDVALRINEIIKAKGYVVDDNDQSTWKYYMNLAGEYHQSDLDEIQYINKTSANKMQIKIASDTGSINVDFTKQLIDPITGNVSIANEYQYGGFYYNELLSNYPEHEELILGILNPIDISIAIAVEDNSILYMGGYFKEITTDLFGTRTMFTKRTFAGRNDKYLIEDNETSVITDTELYVKNFFTHWHNPDYVEHNNLYIPSVLGVLYSKLINYIVSARIKRIQTSEAHSFFIKEFFDSNGYLAKYIPPLPIKQTLYLYRNMGWLQKYVAREESFKALVENLATPCGVPLSGYSLRHNLTHVPENLLPTPVVRREVINFRQAGSSRDSNQLLSILNRELPLARDNYYDLDNVKSKMEERLTYSQGNRLPTKIVDSQMVDFTDVYIYPLSRMLYDMWLYTASTGKYTGVIYVTNPSTGDRISLTPRNAFILAVYCYHKGNSDTELVNIPVTRAFMIPRETTSSNATYPALPTASALKAKVPSEYITEDICNRLIGTLSIASTFASADIFYTEVQKLHNEFKRRYTMAVKHLDIDARAQMEFAISQLYWYDYTIELSTLTYPEWFIQTGISLTDISKADYTSLANNIVKQAIGNRSSNSDALASLQEAVIGIMKHFSSYTTQFITSLNNSNAVVYEAKTLRSGNINSTINSGGNIRINNFSLLDFTVTTEYNVEYDLGTVYDVDP